MKMFRWLPPIARASDMTFLVATTAIAPPHAPSMLRHRARVSMSGADLGQSFRRAEVWSSDTATLTDVINVVGRWESCSEWRERTEFREDVEEGKMLFFEDPVQPYTRKKYDMAVKLGTASRVALLQNINALPFTNERLAASVGKSAAEFNAAPISEAAVNVVFDALAESKNSLVAYAVVDERRAAWLSPDGGFDVGAYSSSLAKAQAIVSASSLILYIVTPLVAAALIAKVLHLV